MQALYDGRSVLGLLLFILAQVVIISSSMMYHAEHSEVSAGASARVRTRCTFPRAHPGAHNRPRTANGEP